MSICLPVALHRWLMGLTATAVLGEPKITSPLVRRQTRLSQEAGRQKDTEGRVTKGRHIIERVTFSDLGSVIENNGLPPC